MKAGHGTDAPRFAAPGGKPAVFEPPKPDEIAGLFPGLDIIELLGKGGMGAVYKVRQKDLGRVAALKILPQEASGDPAFAERFTREAQALARLNHTNILTVYEFGQASGLYFFLMEYVEGVNLRRLIQTHELSPRQALQIIPEICAALQYAHDEGLVHRDIKPENILVDKKGRIKIADFGLAKLMGSPSVEPLTRAAEVMGTPHYMAPEQIEHPLEVDHRADIYSLGVVFYEMLTGELPLGRFPLPSQKVAVDVRLDEVVLRALEKEPARRYQNASDIKTEVEVIRAAPDRFSIAPAAPASQKVLLPWWRRRVVVGLGAVIVFWLVLLGGIGIWQNRLNKGTEALLPPGSKTNDPGQPEMVAVPALPEIPLTPPPSNLVPVRISTYAGGEAGYLDGPREQAQFFLPYRIRQDKYQRLWIVESGTLDFDQSVHNGHHIRMIDGDGIVTTIAGDNSYGMVDGPARSARFRGIKDVAFDRAGNAFIADMQNHRIRKLDTNGMVSTYAGSIKGFSDGRGLAAQFYWPLSVVVDSANNLYIADFGNCVIRRISPKGEVTTLSGSIAGHRDGPVRQALFNSPNDLAMGKDGALYVSDWKNGAVRKIETDGMVTTIVVGLGFVESLAVDANGSLYVSCSSNNQRYFHQYNENGELKWSLVSPLDCRDGDVPEARFGPLSSPVILPDGNLLISDISHHRIRLVTMAPKSPAQKDANATIRQPVGVTTYAGSQPGSNDGLLAQAKFYHPHRVKMDRQGRIWILEGTTMDFSNASTGGHRVRRIETNGMVVTIAGSSEYGSSDGAGLQARFCVPTDLDFDDQDNVYIVDSLNHRIRKIDAKGRVSTFAGFTAGIRDGIGSNAAFSLPTGLVIDQNNNLYVADFSNLLVRKINAQADVTTLAGRRRGHVDGVSSAAAFDSPWNVSLGRDGNLVVSDRNNGAIRKVTPDGVVSTLISGLGFAEAVSCDAEGNLYVASSRNDIRSLQKFTAKGQLIWSTQFLPGFADGPIGEARFRSISYPVVMPDGNLLVADMYNHRLRLIVMGKPKRGE